MRMRIQRFRTRLKASVTVNLLICRNFTEYSPISVNEFSFEGYPVSGLWRDQLDAVKKTHDIVPLPAYGSPEDSDPIKPSQYHARLAGAVVLLSMPFVSWKFGSKSCNLVAKVEEIHVLVPPKKLPLSLKKRKFKEACAASPSKKAKKAEDE